MTKLEEARAFFAGDRFATENGAVIDEIGADYAVCSMEITPHHLNAAGRIMGGAVFLLADFAFAVASNFGHPADVTTTSQITFLRPSQGKLLYAKSQELRRGRTAVYYETSVTDDTGALIARVTASGQVLA